LLIVDGRADDRPAAVNAIAAMSDLVIAHFLRDTDPATLLEAYMTDDSEGIPDVPNVFADGTVLPFEPPLERLATPGGYNEVPIMLGTNRDEVKIFMFASPDHTRQLLGFLPRLRDADAFNGEAEVSTLAWKLQGADAPADAMRRSGARDVFVYRWDWDEEPSMLGADLSEMIGASHGFEIPFVFGHYDLGPRANVVWTDENRAGRDLLSDQMMSYWTEFARSGRPGKGRRGDQAEWGRWELASAAPKLMLLDTPAGGGLRMSSEATTAADVIELVRNDPRLDSSRCDVARSSNESLEEIGEPPMSVEGCDAPDVAAMR
jgi:para-nitrobenzyl esterase